MLLSQSIRIVTQQFRFCVATLPNILRRIWPHQWIATDTFLILKPKHRSMRQQIFLPDEIFICLENLRAQFNFKLACFSRVGNAGLLREDSSHATRLFLNFRRQFYHYISRPDIIGDNNFWSTQASALSATRFCYCFLIALGSEDPVIIGAP